jgi:uncharacterized phage-associated protein/DNA-binding transcriptional regulator YiaG
MLSPFTGKEMTVQKEWRSMTFKKETFKVCFHTWKCEDTGEQFEDDQFAQLNYEQVQNQYRAKYNIPFKEEIIALREKYDLSAIKMSQVLCFGDNTYRQYEAGEMPSQSNSRLIQLSYDPHEFQKLVALSKAIEGKTLEKLNRKIEHEIEEQRKEKHKTYITDYLFGATQPSTLTGFKKPDFHKFSEMVFYFSEELKPWKTKLNKLLFYTDFTHFKKHGTSLSGVIYRAIPMGPVPDKYQSIYDYLTNDKIIEVNTTFFADGGLGEQFLPAKDKKFNKNLFTEGEFAVMSEVVERFRNTSTSDIIEISHQEKAWIENKEDKNVIDYFYAFDLN